MCDNYSAKRKTEKQMGKHLLVWKQKKILKCKVCVKIYDDKNHMEEQEDIHVSGGKHYSCGEKLEDGTLCLACYSGKASIHLHMTNVHKGKLAKSMYMRKLDAELTYETLQEYQKKIQEKTQDLGTFTV